MTAMKEIQDVGKQIAREFKPQRIILFGSHARGTPTDDSDVDLLVIMPFSGKPIDKSVEIRLKVRPSFPIDLLVRTPEKIQQRLEMGDDFIKEILQTGKTLYESLGG